MENTQLNRSELLRKRRGKNVMVTKWSDAMSPEAQVAMKLAREDTRAMKEEEENKVKQQCKSPTRVAFADETRREEAAELEETGKLSRNASFSELYERNGSARMRRDITDDTYSEDKEQKRALGGGKVESAMEIIEIVNHDIPDPAALLDEHAIDELARINSVDKCAVWIEATQEHHQEGLPKIPEANEAES